MLSAVKRVRLEKGFTQRQVGEMVGINRASICNIEQKRLVPNAKQRKAIADFLGGQEADFFEESGLAK